MKKKKAFTLIELLAVIVILAIILIIAVPRITDTIEKSKKGAIESSAKLIARDVENKYATSFAIGNVSTSGSCMEGLNTNEYSSCTYEIDNNGKASVTLTGSGKFEGYTCTGDKNNVTCTTDEIVRIPQDASCFYYHEDDEDNSKIIITGYENSCGKDIVIPEKIEDKDVAEIDTYAFKNNTYITSVYFPNTIKIIGYEAFAGCENLTTINLPSSLERVFNGAFFNTSLTIITDGNNPDTAYDCGVFRKCWNDVAECYTDLSHTTLTSEQIDDANGVCK